MSLFSGLFQLANAATATSSSSTVSYHTDNAVGVGSALVGSSSSSSAAAVQAVAPSVITKSGASSSSPHTHNTLAGRASLASTSNSSNPAGQAASSFSPDFLRAMVPKLAKIIKEKNKVYQDSVRELEVAENELRIAQSKAEALRKKIAASSEELDGLNRDFDHIQQLGGGVLDANPTTENRAKASSSHQVDSDSDNEAPQEPVTGKRKADSSRGQSAAAAPASKKANPGHSLYEGSNPVTGKRKADSSGGQPAAAAPASKKANLGHSTGTRKVLSSGGGPAAKVSPLDAQLSRFLPRGTEVTYLGQPATIVQFEGNNVVIEQNEEKFSVPKSNVVFTPEAGKFYLYRETTEWDSRQRYYIVKVISVEDTTRMSVTIKFNFMHKEEKTPEIRMIKYLGTLLPLQGKDDPILEDLPSDEVIVGGNEDITSTGYHLVRRH